MRALLIAAALLGGVAHADESERATRLATLRGEVEARHHELTLDKAALSSRLQTLDLARTDLEVQLRQEELAIAQLRLSIGEEQARVAASGDAQEGLKPAVLAGMDALVPAIRGGLPYRVPERLEAVEGLRTQVNAGTLAPAKAAHRLWQTLEDELRLGRENALDRQIIALDGQEVLVDVARIGLVALFFRTPDGAVGWAERRGDTWTFVHAEDRAARGQILQLFDSLDKQIRVGAFTLPAVLPEVTR